VRLLVEDGVNPAYVSGYHTGSGRWEFLAVKGGVSISTSEVQVSVEVGTGGVVLIDGAVLYQLTSTFTYVPNPQDDIKMPGGLIYTDPVEGRVGIGTASPQKTLDVAGEIRASILFPLGVM
jgi:hypothetical protein